VARIDIPIDKLVKGKKPAPGKGWKYNSWKGLVYVQSRDSHPASKQTPAQRAWVANFKQLACWSKYPDPYAFDRATQLAKNTNWYYRDVIESALSGKLIQGIGEVRITTPTARVSRSTAQNLTVGVPLILTPDTQIWDNNAFWHPVTNPTRLTVRSAGLYLVGMSVVFNGVSGTRINVALRHNGSLVLSSQAVTISNSSIPVLETQTLYYFHADDYVEARALSDTAGRTAQLNQFWIVAITPETLIP